MVIQEQYHQIQNHIAEIAKKQGRDPKEITLVAVSKNCPVESIEQAYQAGCRHFGENRIQEALSKIPVLPTDICWHLIGTLQSNKINKALSSFGLIHSVEDVELAKKIAEAAKRRNETASILLQVNTSGEQTKHGLTCEQWKYHLEDINALEGLQIVGLMTMAPLIEDEKVIRNCFARLRQFKDECLKEMRHPQVFRHLSMGMSHDYPIAIEEGATLVRIGTAIFQNNVTDKGRTFTDIYGRKRT